MEEDERSQIVEDEAQKLGTETPRATESLEARFDRLARETNEAEAIKDALARAEQAAEANAAMTSARLETAGPTLDGALLRIGAEVSFGNKTHEELKEVQREFERLVAEQRAALAALRAEATPRIVVAEEVPDDEPTDALAAWSAEERTRITAYMDQLDATDRAYNALAKAKRELKKITDTETDEWEIKADEVTALDKAWRDAKSAARAQEQTLGPINAQLTELDVGRKAGREALRKRMETLPEPATVKAAFEEPTAQEPAKEGGEQDAQADAEQQAARERNERVAKISNELYRELDETGSSETAAADDVFNLLSAIVRSLEERAFVKPAVEDLRNDLMVSLRSLDQWKDDWQQTLRSLEAERDGLASMSPEELRAFVAARAQQAEDAEANIRAIQARLDEQFEVAEGLAYQDARNNPGGAVTRTIEEIRDQLPLITRIVVEKRDALDTTVRKLAVV